MEIDYDSISKVLNVSVGFLNEGHDYAMISLAYQRHEGNQQTYYTKAKPAEIIGALSKLRRRKLINSVQFTKAKADIQRHSKLEIILK